MPDVGDCLSVHTEENPSADLYRLHAFKSEFNPSWFGSSLALELRLQLEWLTDSRQRAAAERRAENLHGRVPLDASSLPISMSDWATERSKEMLG